MSFQAYIDNIYTKTGKTPQDFLQVAMDKGIFTQTTKAKQIIDWLKKDYDLGHGHSMAIIATFKKAGVFPVPVEKKKK
jgi:Domain of unknown function (DUF4287)